MKLKLLSGIYKSAEYGENKGYEGYGIVNENNNPYAFLSWHTKADSDKPYKVKISILKDIEKIDSVPREYNTEQVESLGEGIYRIKKLFVELLKPKPETNDNFAYITGTVQGRSANTFHNCKYHVLLDEESKSRMTEKQVHLVENNYIQMARNEFNRHNYPRLDDKVMIRCRKTKINPTGFDELKDMRIYKNMEE